MGIMSHKPRQPTHYCVGIVSGQIHIVQGALEDKLAHVMVERDAYAAQLADMRRYQGGRITGQSQVPDNNPVSPETRPLAAGVLGESRACRRYAQGIK